MKNIVALAATCLAALMFGLEISSVPVILPTLGQQLHADFGGMQWVMNAYTVACTTVLMAAGTLADRYGRRLVFVLSTTLFGVASLFCGIAENMTALILSRAVQGLGGGSMLICLTAILSQQFKDKVERGRAFAIWGIVFGSGLGLGPIVGGLLTSLGGWRWVFLVHVRVTLLTLALAFATVRESRDCRAKGLDIAGIVTLSLSVLGFVCILMEGPEFGFASAVIVALCAITVLSFAFFIVVEKRVAHPMFDFAVLHNRRFIGAILGSVGVNFSFWPLMIYLPTYFQNCLGYDSEMTGLVLLAYTVPVLLFPPLGEYLSLRLQPRVVIPGGLICTGTGFLLMTAGSSVDHASWLTLLPGCLLAGAGVGVANTPVTNTVTGSVPPDRAGMASGFDMTARLVTLAANIALMGLILVGSVQASLMKSIPDFYHGGELQMLAEGLVAGNPSKPEVGLVTGQIASALHIALQRGFAAVMLYGGLGVWFVAGLSYASFGRAKAMPSKAQVPQIEA
jgi:EmrB/QacA subfamily drug resistance transporter